MSASHLMLAALVRGSASAASPSASASASASALSLPPVLRDSSLTSVASAHGAHATPQRTIGARDAMGDVADVAEFRFARAVHLTQARISAQHTEAAAAAAAAATTDSIDDPFSVVPPPRFGSSSPRIFVLEVWALDERREGDGPHSAAAASRPWADLRAAAAAGWVCLTQPSGSTVDFGASGHSGMPVDCNVTIALRASVPAASAAAAAEAATDESVSSSSAPLFTRHILIRGSYRHATVMLYGRIHQTAAASSLSAAEAEAQVKRSQQQSRRALQPVEQFAPSSPMRVHPCFAAVLPLFPSVLMSALLFDADAADTLERRVSTLLTAAPLSGSVTAARGSLRAVTDAFRAAHLLHELALPPGPSLATHIDDAGLQSLAQLISLAARCLLALDELSRTALLQDESGGFALELEQLVPSLSFLVASASPAAPSESFARLHAFLTQLRTSVPRALLLSSVDLLSVLLHASSSLALVFVEQGAAWAWLLSWLQPTAAVHLDGTLQTAALTMVNALMQHPQSILALSEQQLLPSTAASDDSLRALLSHGLLDDSALRSPLLPPLGRVHRPLVLAIRLKVQLHQLVSDVSAAFGDAQVPHAVTDEQMRAQQQLATAMRKLITFMAASGEHYGEPTLAASLASAFLQHAIQFQLLCVLQSMLSDAGSVLGIALGSPFDVFTEFVRPMMMLGFFGPSCGIQHALHVVSEERVSHQLMHSLRQLAMELKSGASAAAARDKVEPIPPWRQVRALLNWMEGRMQALILVSYASGLHSGPLCSSWSTRLRCAAWSALATFVQSHPFGVESTVHVLRQAQSWREDAESGGAHHPSHDLPFAALQRIFVRVFEVESAYAPLLHAHAVSVLEALMRSRHANALFFAVHGRMPVGLAVGPHCTSDAESFVTHAIAAIGLLQGGTHTDLAWESPLLDALQERAMLLGQSSGVHGVSSIPLFHLVTSLLRCTEGLMHEPSGQRLRGPEAAVTGPGLLIPIASDQFVLNKVARGVRNRIASALFLLPTAAVGDNEPTGASVSVSPIILDLLRVFSRVFEAGEGRSGHASQDQALTGSPKHSARSMQAAAEGLEALLTLLLTGLQHHVHGSTHLRRPHASPSIPLAVEESGASPGLLWTLGHLHAALWAAHQALSTHPWAWTYCERASEADAALSVRPPSERSESLGHLPRIRLLMHACLSHTLFHLLSPAPVPPRSSEGNASGITLRDENDDDRRLLVRSAPCDWWQQLFGVHARSCWTSHLRFLCDVLPPAMRGRDHPRPLSDWQSCLQAHLFRPLFDHVELGPPLSAESVVVFSPPRLLSSFLFSDALCSSSAIDVQRDLVELIARIVESASHTVARTIMQACVTRIAEGATKLQASSAEQPTRPLPEPCAPFVAATADFLPLLRDLQVLHSLAQSSSRVRSLLLDLDALSALHTLMRLSLAPTPDPDLLLRPPPPAGSVGPSSMVSLPESIPMQQLALDIVCALAESEPAPDGHAQHRHASAAMFAPILPTVCSLLLHPHTPIALTSGRLLITLSRSRAGCVSLVDHWLKATPPVDPLLSVSPSVLHLGSPLLRWLHGRLGSCGLESLSPSPSPLLSPARVVPSSLELELWAQMAEIMRLISTLGDHPASSPQPPPVASAAASFSPPPPPDDRWWSACVSARYPGLPSLCLLLRWPVRTAAHSAGSRSALLQSSALTAAPPSASHPLLLVPARLQASMDACASSPDPSARSLCVSSLMRRFEAVMQRMQLATRLHISTQHTQQQQQPEEGRHREQDNHAEARTQTAADQAMLSVRTESDIRRRQPEKT